MARVSSLTVVKAARRRLSHHSGWRFGDRDVLARNAMPHRRVGWEGYVNSERAGVTMSVGDIFWLFFMFTALQPVLRQRMQEISRMRKIARLESKRDSRVVLLV